MKKSPELGSEAQGDEETPEQKATSDALKKMAESVEAEGKPDDDGVEKSDLRDVLAGDISAERAQSDESESGQLSPEDYERAEEALNELLDEVKDEEKWGAVGDFCKRALVVLGTAPITLGRVITAFAESRSKKVWAPEYWNRKRPSFTEALKKEMGKQVKVTKDSWAKERPATDELGELRGRAKARRKNKEK